MIRVLNLSLRCRTPPKVLVSHNATSQAVSNTYSCIMGQPFIESKALDDADWMVNCHPAF